MKNESIFSSEGSSEKIHKKWYSQKKEVSILMKNDIRVSCDLSQSMHISNTYRLLQILYFNSSDIQNNWST